MKKEFRYDQEQPAKAKSRINHISQHDTEYSINVK